MVREIKSIIKRIPQPETWNLLHQRNRPEALLCLMKSVLQVGLRNMYVFSRGFWLSSNSWGVLVAEVLSGRSVGCEHTAWSLSAVDVTGHRLPGRKWGCSGFFWCNGLICHSFCCLSPVSLGCHGTNRNEPCAKDWRCVVILWCWALMLLHGVWT